MPKKVKSPDSSWAIKWSDNELREADRQKYLERLAELLAVDRDFPERWRERYGEHPDFIPIEIDADLYLFASVPAVVAFDVRCGWYERLPELAEGLEAHAEWLATFDEAPLTGSGNSIAELRAEHDALGGTFPIEPVPMFEMFLLRQAKEARAAATEARRLFDHVPSYMRESTVRRGRRRDLGFARACHAISGRIRYYKNDRNTSWPMVVAALEWFGNDLHHLSDVEGAVRKASARYQSVAGAPSFR